MRQDGKLFFAAQKELTNIDPAKEEIFEIGTVCDVLQKIDLPNNNVRLLVKGLYRAKIVEYLKENDYFSVAVEELENKIPIRLSHRRCFDRQESFWLRCA